MKTHYCPIPVPAVFVGGEELEAFQHVRTACNRKAIGLKTATDWGAVDCLTCQRRRQIQPPIVHTNFAAEAEHDGPTTNDVRCVVCDALLTVIEGTPEICSECAAKIRRPAEHEWRCTREAAYPPGSLGHRDTRCRQGYYIWAVTEREALNQMAATFPSDLRSFNRPELAFTAHRVDQLLINE
jgi:hypothetical protein